MDFYESQLRHELDGIFYWISEDDRERQEEARQEKEDWEHKMVDLVR